MVYQIELQKSPRLFEHLPKEPVIEISILSLATGAYVLPLAFLFQWLDIILTNQVSFLFHFRFFLRKYLIVAKDCEPHELSGVSHEPDHSFPHESHRQIEKLGLNNL